MQNGAVQILRKPFAVLTCMSHNQCDFFRFIDLFPDYLFFREGSQLKH